jgi:hypothetical protein
MKQLVVDLAGGPTPSDDATSRLGRVTRRRGSGPDLNAADPLNRRTRTRPDHNRVRDVPSPVSVLGLAPPPPTG